MRYEEIRNGEPMSARLADSVARLAAEYHGVFSRRPSLERSTTHGSA